MAKSPLNRVAEAVDGLEQQQKRMFEFCKDLDSRSSEQEDPVSRLSTLLTTMTGNIVNLQSFAGKLKGADLLYLTGRLASLSGKDCGDPFLNKILCHFCNCQIEENSKLYESIASAVAELRSLVILVLQQTDEQLTMALNELETHLDSLLLSNSTRLPADEVAEQLGKLKQHKFFGSGFAKVVEILEKVHEKCSF